MPEKHQGGLLQDSIVRPQLEYAATVWDKSHINTLEAVQRRAARLIMRDYHQTSSVTAMLKLETLQTRRVQARATIMYLVVRSMIYSYLIYITTNSN